MRLAEAVRALQARVGPRDVPLLELLEVGDPRHDVVALGRVADLHLLETPLGLLLVAHELLHRVPHRVRRRVGGEERDEDELVAELAELLERERVRILVPAEGRRVVERERQPRMRLAHGLGERDRRLARGVAELRPDEVDARVRVRAAPADRLLQAPADGAVGVRPRDDDEVGVEAVPRIDRGPILADRLVEIDDRLARDVAAALWEALVLQVDTRDARLRVLLHRPDRGERVAVAVVRVRDDRQARPARDHGGDTGDLGLREEAHVGPAVGHRHRVAAEVDGLHPHALGELGPERIIDAGGEQVRLGREQLAERASHVVHGGVLLGGLAVRERRRAPAAVVGGLHLDRAAPAADGPAQRAARPARRPLQRHPALARALHGVSSRVARVSVSVHAAPLVPLTLPSDGEQSNVIVFIGKIKYIYQLWNPREPPSGNPAGRGVPGGRHLRGLPPRRGGAAAHPARRQRADPGARGVARREALRARPARLRPLRGGARLPPPGRAAPPGRGARAPGGPRPPAAGGRRAADRGGALDLHVPLARRPEALPGRASADAYHRALGALEGGPRDDPAGGGGGRARTFAQPPRGRDAIAPGRPPHPRRAAGLVARGPAAGPARGGGRPHARLLRPRLHRLDPHPRPLPSGGAGAERRAGGRADREGEEDGRAGRGVRLA